MPDTKNAAPTSTMLHTKPHRATAPSATYRRGRKNWRLRLAGVAAALTLAVAGLVTGLVRWLMPAPSRVYTAADFGIATLHSPLDRNGNGVDDYTDILLGARRDAENHPRYDGSFYAEGGYPPDDVGVCTDVVWRALRYAGYSLKDLVDEDIRRHPALYPGLTGGVPDPNIDFRRVVNLQVFLERYAQSLTLDLSDIAQWQPGDIVVFEGARRHIGIVSDRRNQDGIPWLIHNSGQPHREEDVLARLAKSRTITGHYRWDGESIVPLLE